MSDDNSSALSSNEVIQSDALSKLCCEQAIQGATQDEIILFLHTQGATFDNATVIFRKLFGGSFGEIYSLFQKHSVWHEDVEASIELTREFIECFDSEDKSSEDDSQA